MIWPLWWRTIFPQGFQPLDLLVGVAVDGPYLFLAADASTMKVREGAVW